MAARAIAHMAQRPHGIFLMKTFRSKSFKSRPLELTMAQRQFRELFYAYVRMTPNEQGLQETVPLEGSLFTFN